MDLTEFLTARLDEDEEAARAVNFDPSWTAQLDRIGQPVVDGNGARLATGASSALPHIARHDPARVLREVEASRAIVALHEASVRAVSEGLSASTRNAVAHLAAVYADHPDYRQEWRP